MIAVKRLQSLFWVLLVALGALSAYLVSLRVATERNAVNRERTQIAQARADIRYLETEFSARANMRQLERWNEDDYRYSTPTADRYLEGERALAHLDGIHPNGPDYVAPPVMVAMVETDRDLPSAMSAASASPAATQISSDVAVIRTAQAAEDGRERSARSAAVANLDLTPAAKPRPAVLTRMALADAMPRPSARVSDGSLALKAERMAMLDSRLLDDGTLGELGRKAAAESRQGRR